MLTKSESAILLQIAREAIQHQVNNESYSPSPREEKALNERSGCFVTIRIQGRLRGCIGNFQSQQPLYREVAQMAAASAAHDPRFSPLRETEMENIKLEITVLSPLEKIEDPELIEIGSHGIYIEKGFHRGVLLPQVATEYGWDRLTFLQQTCVKAGLPTNAWQDADADIYRFSGLIIEEEQS